MSQCTVEWVNNMEFRDAIHQQALEAQRTMVRTGELLSRTEFCMRLAIDEAELARLVKTGSLFAIDVEGVPHYPSLLANPAIDQHRLRSVCRLLVPAAPMARLIYLSSAQGNLGNRAPVDALNDDSSYRHLRQMARAWAAEWCRTTVKIYLGSFVTEPADLEPAYTAVDEVDPRNNIWKRAVGALQAGGFVEQSETCSAACMSTATVFIVRSTSGCTRDVLEARLDLQVDNDIVRAHVAMADGKEFDVDGSHGELPTTHPRSIPEIVYQLLNAAQSAKP